MVHTSPGRKPGDGAVTWHDQTIGRRARERLWSTRPCASAQGSYRTLDTASKLWRKPEPRAHCTTCAWLSLAPELRSCSSCLCMRLLSSRMEHALAMLRSAVTLRWESVDQVLKEHGDKPLGDPDTPGTGAWHIRHTVEIFREHARVMRGDADPDTRAIPSTPRAMRDALLADVDGFIAWARAQPGLASRTITYGPAMPFIEMLAGTAQHITWHAGAVHYWTKWRMPAKT